jgi:MFS family permease
MRADRLPRRFWLHFSASTISNLGDGVVLAAAPLLALTLTDDARLIGLIGFAGTLPWLLLSLHAGVVLDRLNRRMVLIAANGFRAMLFVLLALVIALDALTIWMLLIVVLLLAIGEVFFDMGAQAFLPMIVDEHHLECANGRLYAAEITANSFLGLPLGAWLFALAAAVPFGLHGAALAIAAVLIATIRTLPSTAPPPTRRRVNTELREGFVWLWHHPLLRTLALMLGAANMCHMFAHAMFAKYARDVLGLGPTGFGLLLAVGSLGSIVGALLGSRLAKMLGPAVSIVVSYVMFAALEVLPAAFPNVPVVVVASTLMALFGTLWNVITVSLRQRIIPADLFGRVNSVYRFLGTGTTAIGAVIGGQIAFHFGLRATYLASAATLAVVLVVGGPRLLAHASRHEFSSTR